MEDIQNTTMADSQEGVEVSTSTGLPSDTQEAKEQEAVNDWKALNEKEPEFMKQFKSLDDFKDKYKELWKQYSTTVQKHKEGERAKEAEAKTVQEQQAKQQAQQDLVMEMLPKYLENNMQLTAEMETQLTEAGLDIRDVKLGAIELRDKINNAHSVVGGKEEYEAMIAWGRENLSESIRNDFDKDVVRAGMSELAIRGMYSMYKEARGNSQSEQYTGRISGDSVPSGIKPYATKEEILQDRMYVNSSRGRMDRGAIEKHKARLKVTPDSVFN